MKLRVLARLIEIQRVLVRHGLDEFVRATHLYRPLRFLFLLSPWTWAVRRRDEPRAVRLREALQELGPIFVKFGQALSTRRDLLPAGHRRGARQAAGPRAALRRPHRARHHRGSLRPRRRAGVLDVRRTAAGRRVDRAGARRRAPARGHTQRRQDARGRGQGAAARHARGDRARPRGAARAGTFRAATTGKAAGACGPSKWCASTRRPSSTSST